MPRYFTHKPPRQEHQAVQVSPKARNKAALSTQDQVPWHSPLQSFLVQQFTLKQAESRMSSTSMTANAFCNVFDFNIRILHFPVPRDNRQNIRVSMGHGCILSFLFVLCFALVVQYAYMPLP